MVRKLKPLDLVVTGQDDMYLRQLREGTHGLDDLVSDQTPNHCENVTRSMYRELNRILSSSNKAVCLDGITPYFLYPLFGSDSWDSGMLSVHEKIVVSNGYKQDPFEESGVPQNQRGVLRKRLSSIGLEIDLNKPIEMNPLFFIGQEPTFFRSGMPITTVKQVDDIIKCACAEFPDWLVMRYGTNRERTKLFQSR